MNLPYPKILLATGLCLATPLAVVGNGMRLVSQDGFASARGEAFVATADNASAIYYNPAGIARLPDDQLRSGIYGLYLDPTFEPPATEPNAGNRYQLENKLAAAPQLFLTHALEKTPLTLGMGVYAPYGAGARWPDDTGFRSVAIEGKLTYIRFNPVIAAELLPGFSVGAGVMLDYGSIELEQGLLRTATPFANIFRFEGDDLSVGYNLGLLWQAHEKVSLGVTFRSSTSFTMSGQTEFEQQPIIQPTRLKAEADFEFPMTVVLGISFRPTPRWNLEFNADYTDWSSLGTILIQQQTPPPFPVQQDIPVTLQWQASWNYCFGLTRFLDDGWHVSAGYLFNENSVPDAYYSPLAADLDRHFFSVGVGRKGSRLDFDVAYQFGYGPARTVSGSTPASQPGLFSGQTADGTYKFTSHALLVTLGIRF